MAGKNSKKSAKAVKKGTARRVAAKAAKPREAVAPSSAREPEVAAGKGERSPATKSRGPSRAANPALLVRSAASPSELITQRIAELGDWRGNLLARIRRIVKKTDPDAIEEWKWRGVPVWSHDGPLFTVETYKAVVKMTFFYGASLPDPARLFNASLDGNVRRAIDFHERDAINERALQHLIRAAVARNATRGRRISAKAAKPRQAVASSSARQPKGAAGKGERSPATKSEGRVVGDKPALLAGGNPRIAKAGGDAPVQAYIAAMPRWKRDVGSRLDELIVRTVPNVRKAVRWNSPFYGIEGQGWFLNFHCFTKYVKVAFFRGTSLRPLPPGESRNKDTRYLDIHEDDQLDEELVASWIKQASELPGWGNA